MFLVLVCEKLTQQCVLGADFLIKTGCMVDLQRGHLVIGKEVIPLQSHYQDTRGIGEVASYCVALLEDDIVPPLHQVQLPVQLQTKDGVEYDGVLEPSKMFTERHQLLLAHSVVHSYQQLNEAQRNINCTTYTNRQLYMHEMQHCASANNQNTTLPRL